MSDNQPNHEFMDGQWSDLPVPDGEQAWQKMNALLDGEDKKRPIVPPLFLRSCALWGTLLLTVAAALWFLFTGNADHTIGEAKQQPTQVVVQKPATGISTNPSIHPSKTSGAASGETAAPNNFTRQNTVLKQKRIKDEANLKSSDTSPFPYPVKTKEQARVNKEVTKQNHSIKQPSHVTDTKPPKPTQGVQPSITNPTRTKDTTVATPVPVNDAKQNTSAPAPSKDTTKKALAEPAPAAAASTIKPPGQKLFYFTAGIGEQQQIPVAGQAAFPYNYYGRKGSISDYIPSLYVRLHWQEKWFLQAEFRYGAPQSVNDFSFSRQTKYDATTNNITTTSLVLKKTYYHQVPLSFNYYVAPRLSVGLGGVYSRFYGAITEEVVRNTNLQTQAETVSTKLIQVPHFNDSFLYKTQVHLLFQTDYQWKRFSFGLRYKKDMQPYIKYTTPNGDINTEKNQTLEFILRYRVL